MLAAAEDEGRTPPRVLPPTPAERAEAARLFAEEQFDEPLVCRACVLKVVARLVRQAVEDAERDLRAAFREQMQWPN